MRGNLRGSTYSSEIGRSIPAHAGEPRPNRAKTRRSEVYPRTCGGTVAGSETHRLGQGLSPHMRGNLPVAGRERGIRGSIPAHAGEPMVAKRKYLASWVYPRTCGGTSTSSPATEPPSGLSPHMRGNHLERGHYALSKGSIPAHAGEPTHSIAAAGGIRVYPRTCGGTRTPQKLTKTPGGLSPHMRGNRTAVAVERPWLGSIPAHAGEPLTFKLLILRYFNEFVSCAMPQSTSPALHTCHRYPPTFSIQDDARVEPPQLLKSRSNVSQLSRFGELPLLGTAGR